MYHYRDSQDNECDAVIHLRDGRYALIEIRLGGETPIEDGAKTLKKVLKRIDTTKMGNLHSWWSSQVPIVTRTCARMASS